MATPPSLALFPSIQMPTPPSAKKSASSTKTKAITPGKLLYAAVAATSPSDLSATPVFRTWLASKKTPQADSPPQKRSLVKIQALAGNTVFQKESPLSSKEPSIAGDLPKEKKPEEKSSKEKSLEPSTSYKSHEYSPTAEDGATVSTSPLSGQSPQSKLWSDDSSSCDDFPGNERAGDTSIDEITAWGISMPSISMPSVSTPSVSTRSYRKLDRSSHSYPVTERRIDLKLSCARALSDIEEIYAKQSHLFNSSHTIKALHFLTELPIDEKDKRSYSLLLQNLIAKALLFIHESRDREFLSNLAWCMTRLDFADDELLLAMARRSTELIHSFRARHLTTILEAFATFNFKNTPLLVAIAGQIQQEIRYFDPKKISTTLWALDKLSYRDTNLLDILAQQALLQIQEFTPDNLTCSTIAASALSYKNWELLKALADQIKLQIDQFEPRALAQIGLAFAALGYLDETLFDLIAELSTQKTQQTDQQKSDYLYQSLNTCMR